MNGKTQRKSWQSFFLLDFPQFDSEPEQERPKTDDGSLINDFLHEPIPLPIWLWNLLVIALYLTIAFFVLKVAAILVVGILALLFN